MIAGIFWLTLFIGILIISFLLCKILDNLKDIKYVLHDIKKGLENDNSTKHST